MKQIEESVHSDCRQRFLSRYMRQFLTSDLTENDAALSVRYVILLLACVAGRWSELLRCAGHDLKCQNTSDQLVPDPCVEGLSELNIIFFRRKVDVWKD